MGEEINEDTESVALAAEKKTAELATRLENASKRLEAANKVAQELKITNMLGGGAEAGQEPVKVSKEDKIKKDVQSWFPADLLPFSLR